MALAASALVFQSSPADAGGSSRVVVNEGESIQAAIDAASPGTKVIVKGHHVENVWIPIDGISLVGRGDASITMPAEPNTDNPCTIFDQPASLICVAPPETDDPGVIPSGDQLLDGVSVSRLELNTPLFDAVAAYFTTNLQVTRNTIVDPGCDGVFAIFAKSFTISRNEITGAQCSGITVNASVSGRILRNETHDSGGNGIAVNDSESIVISRNSASGSCIGIGVADGDDGGYGVRDEDFFGGNIDINRNTTNGNNNTCPFGPFNIGLTGILTAGLTNVVISRNTANDNVGAGESVTAGGIFVGDFPNQDGSFTPGSNTNVSRNTATGNASAAGPADLNLAIAGGGLVVQRNHCDVSVPDPAFCD